MHPHHPKHGWAYLFTIQEDILNHLIHIFHTLKGALGCSTLAALAVGCSLLFEACSPTVPQGNGTLAYARWLLMDDSTATVLNPWRQGQVLHTYRLPTATAESSSVHGDNTPYRHAVSATSLHAFLAHRLGAMDRIAGVMDADYIVAPELKAALRDTMDMGNSQSPNLERIKAAGCDLIFASPFENAGYGALETLGVPIVECADYMETSPLGRAEWMRFYGRLLGRAAQADSLFQAEEAAYQALCTRDQSAAWPTVLLGKRDGQAWYVPGGSSYLGALLDDADAHYVFAEEASTGSIPLDFETVYSRAKDADLWLFTYAAPPTDDGSFAPMTYAALAAEDERYTHFRAFRKRHIWACNTLAVPYYDALPWSPAALLRDVVLIVHPERAPGEKPKFFHPVK